MKSAIKTIALLAILSVFTVAQQPVAPASSATPSTQAVATDPNTPTREQIFELLDAMQMRKLMQDMMDNIIPSMMRNMAQQQMQGATVNMNEKQKTMFVEGMTKIESDTMKGIAIDDFLDVFVPIYQKHFTTSDVNALIAFYHTPAGTKLVTQQGTIAQEGMEATNQMMNRRMGDLQAQMMPKVVELLKQVEAAADKAPAKPAATGAATGSAKTAPKSPAATAKKPATTSSTPATTKPPDKQQ